MCTSIATTDVTQQRDEQDLQRRKYAVRGKVIDNSPPPKKRRRRGGKPQVRALSPTDSCPQYVTLREKDKDRGVERNRQAPTHSSPSSSIAWSSKASTFEVSSAIAASLTGRGRGAVMRAIQIQHTTKDNHARRVTRYRVECLVTWAHVA